MGVDTDTIMENALILVLVLWCWIIGTHLESPYPPSLVEAFAIPLTRIGLLCIVILAALWSPKIGILAALAFCCLGADVLFFGKPLPYSRMSLE